MHIRNAKDQVSAAEQKLPPMPRAATGDKSPGPPADFLDLLSDWIWEADAQGVCTYSNASVAQVLGLRPEEVVGKPLPEGLTPRCELPGVTGLRSAHLHSGSGQNVTLETSVSPIYDEDDGAAPLRGWRGVSRDITERLRGEESARQRLELFQHIAEQAGTALYQRSIDDPNWSLMSEGIERLTGYRADEFSLPLWREILQETVLRGELTGMCPSEAIRRFRAGEAAEWRADYRIRTRSGEERWLADVSIPMRDGSDGKVIGSLGILKDITERIQSAEKLQRIMIGQRQAQESLRDSEARFRSAFDDAAIGMGLVSPDGHFMKVNAALCRILGYSEEELLRRSVMEVTHPDDRAATDATIRRSLQGEFSSYRMEKRYLHKRGHTVWAEMNGSLVRDGAGRPLYIIGQIQDISDRKQAEEERRYILTSARCLLWYAEITENDEGTLDWHVTVPDEEAAQRFVPLPVQPGLTYADAAYANRHPDDTSHTDQYALSRVRAGQGYCQEYRCRSASGEWRWLQEQVHVETIERGWWRAVGVVTDVTEQRRAQEEIEQRTTALENAVEGIAWLDAEAHYMLVNPAYARTCGYDEPLEMIGLPWQQTVHPNEHAKMERAIEEMRRMGKAETETVGLRRDETVFHQQVMMIAAHEGDRFIGHYCFMKDITDRKLMEAQMLQSEKLAALGELVAGVAHEINNPLAAISGTAQLLQMHPDEQVQADAATIHAMTQRAERIVRSLRNFSRSQVGDEKVLADLNRAVEGVIDMVGYALKKSEVVLEVSLDSSLPPVWMNDSQIQQVLLNLINNAEHALRQAPSERRFLRIATVRREDEKGAPWAEMTVCDTGCGIDAPALGRIFDPFFTTKDIGEGTGLGLSICHGIVKAHGGTINVHSRKGEGTAFIVRLPLTS